MMHSLSFGLFFYAHGYDYLLPTTFHYYTSTYYPFLYKSS